MMVWIVQIDSDTWQISGTVAMNDGNKNMKVSGS